MHSARDTEPEGVIMRRATPASRRSLLRAYNPEKNPRTAHSRAVVPVEEGLLAETEAAVLTGSGELTQQQEKARRAAEILTGRQ